MASKGKEVLNALDVAKTQMYHFTAIVIAGMGFFTDAYDLFSISLVTKLLGRIYYHVDGSKKPGTLPPNVAAAVNGVAFCGTLAGQLFFGWLGDKLGRKKVYGITLMVMVLCSLGSGLSFGPSANGVMATLCFFRFWLGFGIGGDYPLSATIMSEYANKKTRGAFIAAVFAMQGFGILAGGIVSLIVSSAFDHAFDAPTYEVDPVGSTVPQADYVWRIVLMFGAIPALLTYYWRMKMPETARYTALVAQNTKQAAADMSKMGDHCLVVAGEWSFSATANWTFVIDKQKMSRIIPFHADISLSDLQQSVLREFYGNTDALTSVTLSYWPPNSNELATGLKTPPVLLTNEGSIGFFNRHFQVNKSINLFAHFIPVVRPDLPSQMENPVGYTTPLPSHKTTAAFGFSSATGEGSSATGDGYASSAASKIPPFPNTFGLFTREFARRHSLHLVGTTTTWFLLDIAYYSSNLFQKDIFSAIGWIPPAETMNAIHELFTVSRAQTLIALCGTVPGYWFTVAFIDRLGRFFIQLMGFIFMTVFMFALAIPYDHWTHRDNRIGFLVMYSLTMFFANFGPNATTFVVPAEIFPARLRSTCHGISAASGKAGAIVGAFGFLYAAQSTDPDKTDAGYPPGIGVRNSLLMLGGVNFLGIVFTLLVPESKGRSLEELSREDEEQVDGGDASVMMTVPV